MMVQPIGVDSIVGAVLHISVKFSPLPPSSSIWIRVVEVVDDDEQIHRRVGGAKDAVRFSAHRSRAVVVSRIKSVTA